LKSVRKKFQKNLNQQGSLKSLRKKFQKNINQQGPLKIVKNKISIAPSWHKICTPCVADLGWFFLGSGSQHFFLSRNLNKKRGTKLNLPFYYLRFTGTSFSIFNGSLYNKEKDSEENEDNLSKKWAGSGMLNMNHPGSDREAKNHRTRIGNTAYNLAHLICTASFTPKPMAKQCQSLHGQIFYLFPHAARKS
jgi:hypothetical protein